VISGSLAGWGDPVIQYFQLAICLVVPTDVRLTRIKHRDTQRFGADALSPGGSMHESHSKFLAWAAKYDDGDESVSLRLHEAWLATLPCAVLRLDGTRSLSALVEEALSFVERSRRQI
jgi:hypothetical protein